MTAEEMDKKLLLAMQYQCNFAGLAVPWDDIGNIMGEGITGGAVIQHLAKLRIRMITQGLPVPPPLRRGGGGSRISTAPSAKSKAKATSAKNGSARATPAKPKKKTGKKGDPGSDESEDDDDPWNDDDSDAEYGQPAMKRVKSIAKGPVRPKIKAEDSDEEKVVTPSKRKHQSSKSSSRFVSAYGDTDINGVPIDYDSDNDEDVKTELVATGAPFLALEDDYVSHPKTGKKTPYTKKKMVVSLPTTFHKTGVVEGIKEEGTALGMSDDESEEEVIGGGVESCVDESHVLSNNELDQMFSEHLPEPAYGSTNNHGVSNNSFDHQAFGNTFNNNYNNPSAFQASGDIFDNTGVFQGQTMGQSGGFEEYIGRSFSQNNNNFGLINEGYTHQFDNNGDIGASIGNDGMSNDILHPDAFSYQGQNGYGLSSQVFGNNFGGHSFSNTQRSVPYQINTAWSSNDSLAAVSNETSVNQTPADTSAGVETDVDVFASNEFDFGQYDQGMNDSYSTGLFDGNFVGDGLYGGNPFGH